MTSIRKLAGRLIALSAMTAATAVAQGIGGLPVNTEDPPTRQGTRGANFLHIPIGARGNAMGGAIGSTVTGSTAWFWNPAGAATIESFAIAMGRQNLYGDLGITQSYAAVSFPMFGGAIGVAVNSLNSGDIPLTLEGTPFGDAASGQFFSWTSTAASAGFAKRLTDRLDVGGSLKYVSEGIKQIKSTWISADVGTQFRTGLFGLVLGGSLMSVGNAAAMNGPGLERGVNTNDVSLQQTRFKLLTRPVDLPTTFRFSAGDDLYGSAESLLGRGSGQHTVYGEFAVTDAVDAAASLGLGVEYGFKNRFFGRIGKKMYNDERSAESNQGGGFLYSKGMHGTSLGGGVRLMVNGRPFRFDYSFTALGDLRDIQVFSLEFGGR
ncbi:MAG TPA: PorV/PorQ family protein [Gemmatimonadaceae bacterium]|nr:PorV/PorQ family protein [Gemmatimonadaceae bacterium]